MWTVSAVNITSFNVLSEKHSCHFTLQSIRELTIDRHASL